MYMADRASRSKRREMFESEKKKKETNVEIGARIGTT